MAKTYTTAHGVTVNIERVNPLFLIELSRDMAPPQPPKARVNYGDDAKPDWREEDNPSDPKYLQSVEQHEIDMRAVQMRASMQLFASFDMDELPESVKKDVSGRVAKARKLRPACADMSDEAVYLIYCVSFEDQTSILALINGSTVNAADIQAAEAAFPG